ncbi:MAG TPA: hypothetical protein PK297_02480 [Spirochaetota bacterium]|nr:hypothetical protein [Spirochaetota bacterium]
MTLKSTNLTIVQGSGFVLSNGLSPVFRIIVLGLITVIFIMTLSSEYAYRDEFRIAVIVVSLLLIFVIGPRSNVFFIKDEKVIKVLSMYFIFKREHEYKIEDVDLAVERKKLVMSAKNKTITLAYSGKNIDLNRIREMILH